MKTDVQGRCDTCRWWGGLVHPGALTAPCRLNPPQVNTQGQTVWPQTRARDWCGAWEYIKHATLPMDIEDYAGRYEDAIDERLC